MLNGRNRNRRDRACTARPRHREIEPSEYEKGRVRLSRPLFYLIPGIQLFSTGTVACPAPVVDPSTVNLSRSCVSPNADHVVFLVIPSCARFWHGTRRNMKMIENGECLVKDVSFFASSGYWKCGSRSDLDWWLSSDQVGCPRVVMDHWHDWWFILSLSGSIRFSSLSKWMDIF